MSMIYTTSSSTIRANDEVVYRDEQQRSYVSTGILMASYFGCRSVSMFHTRSRFKDDDGAPKPVDHATAAGQAERC